MSYDVNLIIILAGLAAVAFAVLLLRMGRKVALFLLVVGALVVLVAVALSMLAQAQANRETAIAARQAAEAAQIASAGQGIVGAATSLTLFVLVLLLVVVILGGGALAGYLWLRSRLVEWQRYVPPRQMPRRSPRPYRERLRRPILPPGYVAWGQEQESPQLVFYVDERGQEVAPPIDPAEWGWN